VTVRVQTATLPIVLKLSLYRVCWNCHFTGCVRSLILPGGFGLSLFPYLHMHESVQRSDC